MAVCLFNFHLMTLGLSGAAYAGMAKLETAAVFMCLSTKILWEKRSLIQPNWKGDRF